MPDIVTPPLLPDGTPAGAVFAANAVARIINATWNLGLDKSAGLEAKIQAAIAGWFDDLNTPTVSSGTVTLPSILEPGVTIPESADTADVMSLFDTKYLELVEMLVSQFVEFRATYFPDENAAYTAAEDWLQAAMDNPRGLPAEVLQALLADDEARVLTEASRAADSVLATFAARGFPLPPGAAASAVLQIQQTAQDQLSETSRKIITASIEQLKWNVTQLLNLRQIAMSTAVDYIKALASGPDMASRLVGIGYDAQSKLINAAAAFYNARTGAQELIAKVGEFNVSTALDADSKNQQAELTLIEDKLKALLAECQALAQMATSLFNNLHTSAGTGYSFSMN